MIKVTTLEKFMHFITFNSIAIAIIIIIVVVIIDDNRTMKCKICNKPMHAGTWKEIYPSFETTHKDSIIEEQTLVSYDSPDGHNHDDNCLTRIYICKNKHQQKIGKQRVCPSCNWKGKLTCSCHEGNKVTEWP